MLDHLLHITRAWFNSLEECRWTIFPSVLLHINIPDWFFFFTNCQRFLNISCTFYQILNSLCDSGISKGGLLACGLIPYPWYNTVPTSSHWSDQKWLSLQPWWENWDGQWESRMDIRSETAVQAQTRNLNSNIFWPGQWYIEKENFKWTIVGFVLTEKRDPDWGHFKTILTTLVRVGRAGIKQKMSKAVLHFFSSVNSMFLAVKEGNVRASGTGAYQIRPDSTQTNNRLPSETSPVNYAHDWALTCHSLWSGHHSARPFP